jgi:hypothetical protein
MKKIFQKISDPTFRFNKSVVLLFILCFSLLQIKAQTISTNPAIGVNVSTTTTYGGCTSSANVIQVKASSNIGGNITYVVSRVNGAAFSSSGTVNLCISSPCGTSQVTTTYTTGTYSTSLIYNGNLLVAGSSINLLATTTSTANLKCHSGFVSVSKSIVTGTLTTNPSSVSFTNTANTQVINVSNNTLSNASISNTNNSVFSTSTSSLPGNSSSSFTISVGANTTTSARNATITLTAGSVVKTIAVSQAGANSSTCQQYLMTHYSQCNTGWSANYLGNCSTAADNICQIGCVITSATMLHASETGSTAVNTPALLNSWLANNAGYASLGGSCKKYVIWQKLADADGSGGLQYYNGTTTPNNYSYMKSQLDLCRKLIVNVNNGAHWVVVHRYTGTGTQASDFKVLDPAGTYVAKTLASFLNGGTTSHTRTECFSGTWATGGSYKTNAGTIEDVDTISNFEFEQEAIIENTESVVLSSEIYIYPNPVVAGSNIKIANTDPSLKTSINIYNATGGKVAEFDSLDNLVAPEIDGLYFIIISSENFNKKIRLVVQ